MKTKMNLALALVLSLAGSAANASTAVVCDMRGNDGRNILMTLASEAGANAENATVVLRAFGMLDTQFRLRLTTAPVVADGTTTLSVQSIDENGAPAEDPIEATIVLPTDYVTMLEGENTGMITITRQPAANFPQIRPQYSLSNCRGAL